MSTAPDPSLQEFLRKQRLIDPGEEATWTALPGGISSDIWRVDLPGRSYCIKRALPMLKWHNRGMHRSSATATNGVGFC